MMFKRYIDEGWDKDNTEAALKYFATEFTLLAPNTPMIRRTGKYINLILLIKPSKRR